MGWGALGRDGAGEQGSHDHISPQFQEAGQGSLCNQAIMLITDGAVEDYEPVLEKYNWPDRKVPLGEWYWGMGVQGSAFLLLCLQAWPMRPRVTFQHQGDCRAPLKGTEYGGDGKLQAVSLTRQTPHTRQASPHEPPHQAGIPSCHKPKPWALPH